MKTLHHYKYELIEQVIERKSPERIQIPQSRLSGVLTRHMPLTCVLSVLSPEGHGEQPVTPRQLPKLILGGCSCSPVPGSPHTKQPVRNPPGPPFHTMHGQPGFLVRDPAFQAPETTRPPQAQHQTFPFSLCKSLLDTTGLYRCYMEGSVIPLYSFPIS